MWKRVAEAVVVASTLIPMVSGASRQNVQVERQAVDMINHSFESPMAPEKIADGPWLITGATIGSPRDRLVLNPDIQNRFGALFAKEPVMSQDFDVLIDLKVTGNVIRNQGFGVWLTTENYAQQAVEKNPFKNFDKLESSWAKIYQEADLEFYGFRRQFDGFGVVFAEREGSPSVQCVTSSKSDPNLGVAKLRQGMPKMLNYANQEMRLDMMVNAKGNILVELALGSSPKIPLCEVPFPKLPEASGASKFSGVYFGMSSFSGVSPRPMERTAEVAVRRVKMVNHDEHAFGDMTGSASALYDGIDSVLEDKFDYKDQKDQTKAMQRLTKMITTFSKKSTLTGLRDRLHQLADQTINLEASVKHLKTEIHLVMGNPGENSSDPTKKADGMRDVQRELRGLRYMLRKDAMGHENDVDTVHKKIKKSGGVRVLSHLATKQDELKLILHDANWIFYMFLVIIFAAGAMMSALFKKMLNVEKKHFI